jgi:hypothetical protein
MRITRNIELLAAAVIIAYISFLPKFAPLQDFLATPIGKVVVIGGIVYLWKTTSALLALLLVVLFVTSIKTKIWEGMAVSAASCNCDDGYAYDASTKKCKNSTGEMKDPKSCQCPPGYAYDVIKKECNQSSTMQDAIPVEKVEPTSSSAGAPVMKTPPTNTSTPITTPGEAQTMATSSAPAATTPSSSGPKPVEKFDLMRAYPLN